ncbi:hypothetical protein DXG01_005408 [Tephrocybe rancida]|nr:hypothetical protein DXG01_005408 [Tephrocybe rancida]
MYLTKPWYAFVAWRAPEGKTSCECPEYNSVAVVWILNPPPAVSSGKIHPSHLFKLYGCNNDLDKGILKLQPLAQRKSIWWSMHPMDPPSEFIRSLKDSNLEFENAVDIYACIVRGIKLKAAWLNFVERKNHDKPWSIRAMRERPMEMAEDNLMGAWINSASEEDVFWLIRQKVPVFIIHKITEMELFLCNNMRRLLGFVARSEAEALMPAYNYLNRKAKSWGKLQPPLLADEWILTPDHLRWDMLDPEKFCYSLSHTFNMPRIVRQPTFSEADEPCKIPISKINSNEYQDDRTPLPVNPAHLPQPLDIEIIHLKHVPWIRPPDIVHLHGGTWEKFTESTNNSRDDCMRRVNKSEELGKYIWYDRERRRYLGFNFKPALPLGLTTDVEIFGMPALNICFEQQVHHGTEVVARSRWMYPVQSPARQHFLAKIVCPTEDKLPRLPTEGNPAKPIPLFLSADSEDEDEGEVEFLSNHENDLFPTILQQKAMAEAKSAQEDLQPKDVIPLPKPSVEKSLEPESTPSQGIVPPPPSPNLDAAEAHWIPQVNSEEVPVAEGRTQVEDVTAKENENSTLNAALAHSSSSDQTKLSPIEVDDTLSITSLPKIQAATNNMDIDLEDDILNYGMSDNETLPINATSGKSLV